MGRGVGRGGREARRRLERQFRIPLSQLRFPPSEKPTFGFALSRQIARLNETSTWPLIARSTNGIVSQFGELHGLELSKSPKRLELLPYTLADLSTKPKDGNPLVKSVDPGASVGLDMKLPLAHTSADADRDGES